MDRTSGKIILKDILAGIMPKEFVYRRKQGFGAPVGAWLEQGAFRNLVGDTLEHNAARIYDFLDPQVTKRLLNEFYKEKRRARAFQIWTLLCLELWCITHRESLYAPLE